MKLALIGATGLVGSVMLKVLEERSFPLTSLLPVASEKSAGKEISFKSQKYRIISPEDALRQNPRIAIFSAGSALSKIWAPLFANAGATVIDNSSAWRMFENIPLIVPEVNADVLKKTDKIIANPNCSTIQLVVVLNPLHKKYKIKRLVISTYQSVTGTGQKAVKQMEDERKGIKPDMIYKYPIDLNCFPHGGDFTDNGYTTEEMKLLNETRKIMGDDSLQITSTVARIPVVGGHSEAVNIEFEKDFDLEDIKELLSASEGIKVMDDTDNSVYPMPLYAKDRDEVFVGRIRRDFSQPKSLNLWIVADNLRKGAATNAIQIAEYISNVFQ